MARSAMNRHTSLLDVVHGRVHACARTSASKLQWQSQVHITHVAIAGVHFSCTPSEIRAHDVVQALELFGIKQSRQSVAARTELHGDIKRAASIDATAVSPDDLRHLECLRAEVLQLAPAGPARDTLASVLDAHALRVAACAVTSTPELVLVPTLLCGMTFGTPRGATLAGLAPGDSSDSRAAIELLCAVIIPHAKGTLVWIEPGSGAKLADTVRSESED